MPAFPTAKAVPPPGVEVQPNSSSPHIHIAVAHHPYVFIAIPDVGLGHADCHYRCWRRGYVHLGGANGYSATGGQGAEKAD
jgi:hypothetical protein